MMGDFLAPPLGLAMIAAVLEQRGHEVKLIDSDGLGIGWLDIPNQISQEEPQVVGTTTWTCFFNDAVQVLQIAKSLNPKIQTVMGGPHPTFTAQETLTNHPDIDFVVHGEGERVAVDLLDILQGGEDVEHVRGISYRADGEVITNPPAEFVDVDSLPFPAYQLLPMTNYHFPVFGKFTVILASRCCSHRCTFCSEWPFGGGRWRPRDVTSVVDEMA